MTHVRSLDPVLDARLPLGLGGAFYGAFPAVVTDIVDPDGAGRVRVRLPWSPDRGDGSYEAWARLATLMAGSGRGSWFVPEVGDEVLLIFECGDTRRPYVVGALWNGSDAPPQTMDDNGDNNLRSLHSRNGVVITFDDTDGEEKLVLETPGGHRVTLDDGGTSVEVSDSNGNVVTLDSSGVSVNASSKVSVQASTVEISASMVTVDSGMSKFSGVVKADTVITNSVVSSSYTPGAGNIW